MDAFDYCGRCVDCIGEGGFTTSCQEETFACYGCSDTGWVTESFYEDGSYETFECPSCQPPQDGGWLRELVSFTTDALADIAEAVTVQVARELAREYRQQLEVEQLARSAEALESARQRAAVRQATRSTAAARRTHRSELATVGASLVEGVESHRLAASPTLALADWYSGVPEDEGVGNDPYADAFHEYDTIRRPDHGHEDVRSLALQLHRLDDFEDVRSLAFALRRKHGAVKTAQLYTAAKNTAWVTPRELADGAATVAWLQRDEHSYRVAWSEADEQRYVIGRLRWQVQTLAKKNRRTMREAVSTIPAARAAFQQAMALKNRWNFQHEIARAGATPTYEVTGWCKTAFGGTFDIALAEIRSARVESQRQPFKAVRAGLV